MLFLNGVCIDYLLDLQQVARLHAEFRQAEGEEQTGKAPATGQLSANGDRDIQFFGCPENKQQ